MCVRKVWIVAALGLVAITAAAELDRAWSPAQHEAHGLEMVAADMGCSPSALTNFFAVVSDGSKPVLSRALASYAQMPCPRDRIPRLRTTAKARGTIQPFDIEDTVAGRDAMLNDLAERGYDGLDIALFGELYRARVARIRDVRNPEATRTVALITWVEDLIQERLTLEAMSRGHDDTFMWWDNSQGVFYTGWHNPADFAFEDGDIVLSLARSSVSHFICASTKPPRWLSHAIIVHRRPDGVKFVEAMLPQGVQAVDLDTMRARRLDSVVIARVRPDLGNRERIIKAASDLALARVGRPYNVAMSLDADQGYFCSSLVALSYADAATEIGRRSIAVTNLLPDISRFTSPAVARFLENIGVSASAIPSPGDLLTSPFVDVVAEYRDTETIFQVWLRHLTADGFIEVLNSGYEAKPHPLARLLYSVVWLRKQFSELSFIPDRLSGQALSAIAAYDRMVYNPAIGGVWADLPQGAHYLCQTSPWKLRGLITYQMLGKDAVREALRRALGT